MVACSSSELHVGESVGEISRKRNASRMFKAISVEADIGKCLRIKAWAYALCAPKESQSLLSRNVRFENIFGAEMTGLIKPCS